MNGLLNVSPGAATAMPVMTRSGSGCCPHCGRRPLRKPGLGAFVLAWIEDELDIKAAAMRSGRRYAQLCEARNLAAWALRNLGEPMQWTAIARLFGTTRRPRNPSDVRHWADRAEYLQAESPRFADLCARLAADVAQAGVLAS